MLSEIETKLKSQETVSEYEVTKLLEMAKTMRGALRKIASGHSDADCYAEIVLEEMGDECR